MSMMGGKFPQGPETVGETVASFPSYEAAQKAVSTLIASDVPARDIAIVGQSLRSIERVTGRLGYASAARSGAINGVLLGLLFSVILVIGTPSVPLQAFVGVIFVGIAIGMLMSIIAYSIVRRRRDFASVMQVVADHYEVTVTDNSLQKARRALNARGAAPATTVVPVPTTTPDAPIAPPERTVEPVSEVDPHAEPPRYGERVQPAAVRPQQPDDSDPPVSETQPRGEGDPQPER